MRKVSVLITVILLVWAGHNLLRSGPTEPSADLVDESTTPASEQVDAVVEPKREPTLTPSLIPTEDLAALPPEEREQMAQIQAVQEELQLIENAPMPEPVDIAPTED